MAKLSAVIITKNNQEIIADCIDSVSFADEVIVVDTGSTDMTPDIASQMGAHMVKYSKGSYDAWRNKGLSMASGEWVLYVDSDERVSSSLRDEIKSEIRNPKSEIVAYAIPRRNVILGCEMKYGGQWPDYQKRLFTRRSLKDWKGDVHEEPEFVGKLGHLQNPLIHLKHDKISEMVTKTNKWSEIEAHLMIKAGHPPMNVRRFFTGALREFWLRMIKNQGFRDREKGFIYAMYQVWSRLVTYSKLWEMQIQTSNKKQITSDMLK